MLASSNFYLKLPLVEALVVVVGAKGKHLEPKVAVAPVEYLVEEAPAVLEAPVAGALELPVAAVEVLVAAVLVLEL